MLKERRGNSDHFEIFQSIYQQSKNENLANFKGNIKVDSILKKLKARVRQMDAIGKRSDLNLFIIVHLKSVKLQKDWIKK